MAHLVILCFPWLDLLCHAKLQAYGQMAHRLMKFAGGHVVAALEGGYNIRATAECAAETVRVLLEGRPADLPGVDIPGIAISILFGFLYCANSTGFVTSMKKACQHLMYRIFRRQGADEA